MLLRIKRLWAPVLVVDAAMALAVLKAAVGARHSTIEFRRAPTLAYHKMHPQYCLSRKKTRLQMRRPQSMLRRSISTLRTPQLS